MDFLFLFTWLSCIDIIEITAVLLQFSYRLLQYYNSFFPYYSYLLCINTTQHSWLSQMHYILVTFDKADQLIEKHFR